MLAALTVDAIRKSRIRSRAVLAGISVAAAYFAISMYTFRQPLLSGTFSHFLSTAGLALAGLVAVWILLHLRGRVRPKQLAIVASTAVVCQLFVLAPHGVYQKRVDMYAPPPFVDFLRQQGRLGSFRILSLQMFLYPNTAGGFGLDDIRALDGIYPARYLRFVQTFLSVGSKDRYVGNAEVGGGALTNLVDNKWLNLTNTRYLIAAAGEAQPETTSLVNQIIDLNGGPTSSLRQTTFTIDGETKTVLFQHPPSQVMYRFAPDARKSRLDFSVALSPEVWDSGVGGPVAFSVLIDDGVDQRVAYRKVIDPKHNLGDRHWVDGNVDLDDVIGKPVSLVLRTEGLDGTSAAWAGWGDLRLEGQAGDSQWERVYSGEVDVFRNREAFPRAFLVASARSARDQDDALSIMQAVDFNPASVAVVEGELPRGFPSHTEEDHPRSQLARVLHQDDQSVLISAESDQPTLLVLSDSFYPGWMASIDGVDADIHPVDLAFQGVFLTAGQHTVEVTYRPKSFMLGLGLALIGALLIPVVLLIAARTRNTSPNLSGQPYASPNT